MQLLKTLISMQVLTLSVSSSRGHKHDGDLLGQQSPDKMDVTLDEDYQEIQVEAKPTREELIAKYQVSPSHSTEQVYD